MRRIALIAAVLVTAGCGSGDIVAKPVTSSVPSSDVTASIQADAGIPPKPDPATQAKFIAALNAIDTEIVNGKEEKAIDRARNQCSSVKESPENQAELVDLTNQRFLSPEHPEGFGKATATKILKAVRTHICPAW